MQQAETKEIVSTRKFAALREVWEKDVKEVERSRQNKGGTTETNMWGPPPSVCNYVWGPRCSWNTPQPTICHSSLTLSNHTAFIILLYNKTMMQCLFIESRVSALSPTGSNIWGEVLAVWRCVRKPGHWFFFPNSFSNETPTAPWTDIVAVSRQLE